MMAVGKKRREEIRILVGPFRKVEDYSTCVDIQREVWRFEDIDIVPVPMLLITEHYGGILLGAYSSLGEMVGFVCSIVGLEETRLMQHSHMLAVRQAYRNFNVGFKLKLAQRKEALKRKVSLITWTFDPMQPLNAYFNMGKLGAWTNTYEENYYGETSSVLHRGLPTDRLVARWELDSKPVVARLEEGPPRRDLRKDLKRLPAINSLRDITPGMAVSDGLKLNFTGNQFLFEVPYNLPEIKARDLGVALDWQGKCRQVFRTYFKKGFAVTDFWVGEQDGHLRAFYLLERRRK